MSQSKRTVALWVGVLATPGLLAACGTTSTSREPADATSGVHRMAAEPAAGAATRCHTSELRASVGRNDPGAGQWNFPVVLTNISSRTCTVYGYPGAAFQDASGRELGPAPERAPGQRPATVTLAPAGSAWAGLSYSNPDVSGARAATPAVLVVTPPDERDPLKVRWTGGQVPVAGNASTVFLTALAPGTGA